MQKKLEIYTILISNSIPLVGVIFFDWKFSDVFIIFCFEYLIISFFAYVKAFLSKNEEKPPNNLKIGQIEKFQKWHIFLLIFAQIYFFWTIINLAPLFLFNLTDADFSNDLSTFISLFPKNWMIIFIILFVNNLVNFIEIFILKKEFLITVSRIHVTIIAWRNVAFLIIVMGGAFGEQVIGLSNVALLLLVICKIIFELIIYFKKSIVDQ